jgi:hypothetical protein
MRYWLNHEQSPALAVRAAGDPREDFDVVPEFWHSGERRWIADEQLADEMFWNPNIRQVSKNDIAAVADLEPRDDR